MYLWPFFVLVFFVTYMKTYEEFIYFEKILNGITESRE